MAINAKYFCRNTQVQAVLRGTYGWEQEGAFTEGPFTFASYLKACLSKDFWADEIILHAISLMWQVTITVVHSDSLREETVRHGRPMDNTDILVLYSGGSHYSAIGKSSRP